MASNTDKIVEGFPFPTISPIVGEPNYETIAAVHLKLNANAASVRSNLGNGQLGLLYLTVSPAVYATLSPIAFVPPVNPGAQPTIPIGANATASANIRRTFDEATAIFKEYDSADKALKQILLGAVDDMFVRALQTKYVGYLHVSTRDILDHLYDQYARISSADLQNNDINFKAPYDANQPIERLFDQIENAIDFAAAGNTPYSPAQVVATAYQTLFATGMFHDDCKTWKRQPETYKTWKQFKADFSLAHREFRETKQTSASAGYQSANSARNHASDNAIYQQETVDAIANLATATAHDRAAVASLTSTISKLTTELTATNAQLVTALMAVTKLTTTVAELRRKTPTNVPRTGPRHYCWTCGHRCLHNSWDCPNPKEGHNKYAKAADTKGGSTHNKPN